MDRLNFFNPFKDKEITHEDVLTRNFLILLKNIPAVQIAFLELIKSKTKISDFESIAMGQLSVSEIYTQVTSGNLLTGIQDHKILSIIISDDSYLNSHTVQESDRNARYDGVMICDPSWVFIIENKPYVGNVWEGQLDPNKEDANGNYIIQEPCCLSWRDIIIILTSLLEHNISSIIEKTIVDDFLEYINETYSWLNPYSRLGLCKGNKLLIDKRCGDILKECFPQKELKYHKGWKHYIDTSEEDSVVRQIALDYDDNSITLWMYAGDIMSAARVLYSDIRTDRIQELDNNYIVRPNFHFSYQGTGLVWFTTSNISALEYIDFWRKNTPYQVSRERVREFYNDLKEKHIVDSNDSELEEKILSKQYPKLNVCPCILLGYKWTLEEAVVLDRENRFADDCMEKIKVINSVYRK